MSAVLDAGLALDVERPDGAETVGLAGPSGYEVVGAYHAWYERRPIADEVSWSIESGPKAVVLGALFFDAEGYPIHRWAFPTTVVLGPGDRLVLGIR